MARLITLSRSGGLGSQAAQALGRRLAGFSGTAVPVTVDDDLIASGASDLSDLERSFIARDRTLKAKLNRALTNTAKRTLRRLQKVSPVGTSGAFRGNWRVDRVEEDAGLRTSLVITNPVPYAKYVHPKGTPRSATVFNTDVLPSIFPQMVVDVTDDVRKLRPALAKAIKAAILKRAAA